MSGGVSQTPAGAAQGLGHDGAAAAGPSTNRRSSRTLRGVLALGVLFVTAASGYAAVLVLFDSWYKGGSIGLF
jgi:hypothetical protein